MENRFGLKDLALFLLVVAALVMIGLCMVQYDRQWAVLQSIEKQASAQSEDLSAIRRQLEQGLKVIGTATPTTAPAGEDPFSRIRAAQAMPDYSKGDWLVDAGTNTDKLTPLVSGDAFAAEVQDRVLETLVRRDPVKLSYQGLLAESGWTVEDHTADYSRYVAAQKAKGVKTDDILKDTNAPVPVRITFTLRPGVTFSDGVALTADDVVWTFNWIMNPKVSAPRDRSALSKIRQMRRQGDNQVVVDFNEPYYDALGLAGGIGVMPRHFYEKYTPDQFNSSTGLLLGSGPYRMSDPASWSPGQKVELLRNDRYWGVQPALSRLVYNIIDNDLARFTTFTNGDIDQLLCAPEQYKSLLKNTDVLNRTQHYEFNTAVAGYRYIAWNEQRDGKPTPFADKRVRQALTMLTDRKRICDQILLGYATPITGPFNPLGKQADASIKPLPFDVAGAKTLLLQAGFKDDGKGTLMSPDGKPFAFSITYPSGSSSYTNIMLFLKDTYAKAGINMTPDPLDWSVFSDRLKNHQFDAISLGWTAGIEDDIYQMFDSSQIADGGDDFMSYRNPDLDAAIEQARQTVDESVRIPLWHKCAAILHEDQPYTFLSTGKRLEFLSKRIANVQKIPLGLNDALEWYVPHGQQKWNQ